MNGTPIFRRPEKGAVTCQQSEFQQHSVNPLVNTKGDIPVKTINLGRRIIALALLAASSAFAQTYPARPIQLVVPYPAGGPLDVAARALANGVRSTLGTVVVDNKAGAGGNIGAAAVARAPADGYTLLLGAVATHAINPSLYAKMPYDAVKDFAPITLIANVPNVLVLNERFAAENKIATIGDLINYAKHNPGKLAYGSGGNGSAGHLAGEMLKERTGIVAVHVPYRGASPAQLGLLSGEIQYMFDNLASAAPRIKEGKLKALAITTRDKAAAFPELQTVSASGISELKDFEVSTWFGLFAPAATPKPILDKLHQDFAATINSPAFAKVMDQLAASPTSTTPEDFAKIIARDRVKYEAVIKRANVKVD
ncbi:MAG: tripartite tricarboxylate transporter substrate binding protein [Ottowia sp.]|uniref:Bug family tripartite tricarboxylate transporter substrate binding protein n=1 Tax=Ottowia sp. TaxID=1898956 RepID=UPI0039E6970C